MLTSSNLLKNSVNKKLAAMSYLGPLDKSRKKGIREGKILLEIMLNIHFFFFPFFWPCLQHVKAPRPGIEPKPQQ